MPKIEVGDIVTIECKVTKVLDDKRIVIRLPGVETPVTIYESSVSAVQKKPAGPKKPTLRQWSLAELASGEAWAHVRQAIQ